MRLDFGAFKRLDFGAFKLDYQRMPKWMGKHRTLAPSYIRGWWRGRCLFTLNVPKY